MLRVLSMHHAAYLCTCFDACIKPLEAEHAFQPGRRSAVNKTFVEAKLTVSSRAYPYPLPVTRTLASP